MDHVVADWVKVEGRDTQKKTKQKQKQTKKTLTTLYNGPTPIPFFLSVKILLCYFFGLATTILLLSIHHLSILQNLYNFIFN